MLPSWKLRNFYVFITYDNVNPTSLRIPIEFTRKHLKQMLANNVQLTVSDGKTWPMSWTISDRGQLWLQNGWPEFADYYLIKIGHLLLFNHYKNSTYHVKIFNRNSCEINYFTLTKSPKTEEETVLHEMEVNTNLALAQRSDNIFTSVTIRASYYRCGLHVPINFCRRLTSNEEKDVECVLNTSDGKTWGPVKCKDDERYGRLFGKNWKKFSDENHLCVGDVCVFELINEVKNEVKVTIIRGLK